METKKKAGRPKKNNNKIKLEQIIPSENSIISLTSDKIIFYKQVLTILSSLGCEFTYIKFDKNDILLYTRDSSENNKILIKIYTGTLQDRYICDNPITVKCFAYQLKDVFASSNPNHDFFSLNVDDNFVLKIELHNQKLGEISVDCMKKSLCLEEPWIQMLDNISLLSSYYIKFDMPIKSIKKTLRAFKKHTDEFIIRYDENDSILLFKYIPKNGYGNHYTKYTDLNLLNFSIITKISNIEIKVKIDTISNFIDISDAEFISFYLHPEKDLICLINIQTIGDFYISLTQ